MKITQCLNNLKCLFGFHDLKKVGGAINIGDGEFKQTYFCKKCKRVMDIVS